MSALCGESALGVIFIGCLLVTVVSLQPLPINTDDLISDLDEFLPQLMSCRKLAGVAIGIVHGNQTVVTRTYGVSNMETKEGVTKDTLFGIASLSKAFTATLLGKILALSPLGYTWDTPIRTILGDDFHLYDELRTTHATIRDLLTHRMGYPGYDSMRLQSGLDRPTLVRKLRFLKPTLPYRASHKYNNLMYGLLTYITEVIGGDTWENLMKTHIFQPLGMTSSDFTYLIDLKRKDLATTYKVDYDGSFRETSPQFHSYWGKIGGAGSIVSNVVDLTKWVKLLLNSGQSEDGTEVIPGDVIEETHTAFETIPVPTSAYPYLRPDAPVSFTYFSYGLAWRIGYYRGWRTIHHTGTSMGYLGKLTLVPDLNIGVITSLTGDDPGYTCRRHIHLHILDLMMGEFPWINKTTTCNMEQGGSFLSEKVKNNASIPDTMNISAYLGTFGNFAFGNITFHRNNTKLMMAYGDWGIWELHPNNIRMNCFDAVGIGYGWYFGFWDIVFNMNREGVSDVMDEVTVHSIERSNPPVFIRGLKMDDAPPPTKLVCDPNLTDTSTATNIQLSGWLVIMLSFCIFMI